VGVHAFEVGEHDVSIQRVTMFVAGMLDDSVGD
jgi:hypothetical protein